jgi:hypothetical protein
MLVPGLKDGSPLVHVHEFGESPMDFALGKKDALENFARVNAIIGKRLTALEKQPAPEATELAALARAVAVAWNGAKDATGLGFAEARASAKLREDSSTKAALVPDVHVQFLDADPASDEGPEDGADSTA